MSRSLFIYLRIILIVLGYVAVVVYCLQEFYKLDQGGFNPDRIPEAVYAIVLEFILALILVWPEKFLRFSGNWIFLVMLQISVTTPQQVTRYAGLSVAVSAILFNVYLFYTFLKPNT